MCIFLFPLLWVGVREAPDRLLMLIQPSPCGSDSLGACRLNHVEDERQTSPDFAPVSREHND